MCALLSREISLLSHTHKNTQRTRSFEEICLQDWNLEEICMQDASAVGELVVCVDSALPHYYITFKAHAESAELEKL